MIAVKRAEMCVLFFRPQNAQQCMPHFVSLFEKKQKTKPK